MARALPHALPHALAHSRPACAADAAARAAEVEQLRGAAAAEKAELAYAVACLEAQMVLASMSHRESLLELHTSADDVAAMQQRAELAEAKLSLTLAQRDEVRPRACRPTAARPPPARRALDRPAFGASARRGR